MSEGPPGKFLRAHFVLEKPWWRHGTWRGRLERVTGQWTAGRHSLCLSHRGGVTLDMGDYLWSWCWSHHSDAAVIIWQFWIATQLHFLIRIIALFELSGIRAGSCGGACIPRHLSQGHRLRVASTKITVAMTGMLIINYTFDENRDDILVEIVRLLQFLHRDYNRAVFT